MRLIELRLKNLNSLKGEWHIDFTDPAFVNEGIFAITGQTGAGKTTILDAICLALYSRTPRLGDITGSTNEMMTQGTGECSAEVVIEIGDRHYRCSWYQHRAHKKAKGNLLPIKHEVSDVVSQKILEEKKSKTASYIQQLIGMDFQQFTRSIMLAQGSFAAFLKSDIADRAAILEKITGTAIYAQISKNVFEKKREEDHKLATLQAGIDSLPLLSSEEEAQLIEEMHTHEQSQACEREALKAVSEQLQWLDKVADLQHQLSHYQALLSTAEQDEQFFMPNAARLDAANKALEIDSPFRELVYNRDKVTQLSTEKTGLTDKLPKQQKLLAQATQDLQAATTSQAQASAELRDTLPIITKARALDADISQQSRLLNDANERKQSLASHISQLSSDIQNHHHSVEDSKNQLIPITDYLENHTQLTALDTDIALFNSHGNRLKLLLQDNAALHSSQQTQQAQACQLQSLINDLYAPQTADKLQIIENKSALSLVQQQQNQLLQDRSLSTMRRQQEDIDKRSSKLERIDFKLQQLTTLSNQFNSTKKLLPSLEQDLKTLQDVVSAHQIDLIDAKQQHKDKQEYISLLQKVAALEDYIIELKAGKPCPLCGSIEHPYIDKNRMHPLLDNVVNNKSDNSIEYKPSKMAQAQTQIAELDKHIDTLEKNLSQANINYATTQNRLIIEQKQLTTLHLQAKTLYSDIQVELTALLSKEADVLASVDTIRNPLRKMVNTITTLSGQVQSGLVDSESISESIAHLLSLLGTAKHSLMQEKNNIKNTLMHYDTLTQTSDDISATIATAEQKLQARAADLNQHTTALQLNAQKTEDVAKRITANFTELANVLAALLAILDNYATGKPDVDSVIENAILGIRLDFRLDYKDFIKPLIDSIRKQTILPSTDYNEHLDHLRQQHSRLLQLKDHFYHQKDTQNNLLNALSTLHSQIETKQTQLDNDNSELNKLQTFINARTAAFNTLQNERTQIFATKHPDEEAERLQAAVDEAKAKHSLTQLHYERAEQVTAQLQARIQQLSSELTLASQTLNAQADTFATLLAQSQFATEADFVQARLAKEERDDLRQSQSTIQQALNHANTQMNHIQTSLNEQLATPKTLEPKETLTDKGTQLQATIDARIAEMGAMQQQLTANEQQKNAQLEQNLAIQVQKQTMQVWQQLYELIGSADGKKYRTFAQGLTFQVMINHANKQLAKMSDRYLLIHDEHNALELNVIDNYQGGEVRSTKNLSGGEGFIISLALALGLSQMASQNIRVDSLFLDEGFGTLDEESLDIALDTLTNLQQEGKLIGIISHVPALKERIMTQIKVKKIAGGFSEISGQGCAKIAG
ncbi:AAA family ATPase [Psychrobacter sp. GP33]|uniref:AAA family ATPase n=1 Tax=Psychrobacter sp. GP33 TaxID=2758709 RepID=UPI0015FC956A|nr:AAA family ATPase [Psychrobacter sp. GP33]